MFGRLAIGRENLVAFLSLIIIGGTLLFGERLDGGAFAIDIDDYLRQVQIEDLLEDGQWYDFTLPGIAMPDPYLSPWSRLVDAPYVFLTKTLSPFIGPAAALQFSLAIVPLFLLIVYLGMFIWAARKFENNARSPLIWIMTGIFSAVVIFEFTPNRIDHHNVQLLFLMLIFGSTLSDWKYSGYLLGFGVLMSLAVGMETTPYIFPLLLGLAALSAMGCKECEVKIRGAGLALMLGTAPLTLLVWGPDALILSNCDTLSAFWVYGLSGGGAILYLAPMLWKTKQQDLMGVLYRIATLGVPALFLALFCFSLFPQCLGGPLGNVDPVTKTYLLDQIPQERSMFWLAQRTGFEFKVIPWILLILISALFTALYILDKDHQSSSRTVIVFVIICAVVFSGLYSRANVLAWATMSLGIPYVLQSLARMRAQNMLRFYRNLTILLAVAVSAVIAFSALPKKQPELSADLFLHTHSCEDRDVSFLSEFPNGTIIAPLGLSASLFLKQDHHKVAAIMHHRAAPGIRRVEDVFGNHPIDVSLSMLSGYDYLAICLADPDFINFGETPLFQALNNGENKPGLADVTPENVSGIRFFRIQTSTEKK